MIDITIEYTFKIRCIVSHKPHEYEENVHFSRSKDEINIYEKGSLELI